MPLFAPALAALLALGPSPTDEGVVYEVDPPAGEAKPPSGETSPPPVEASTPADDASPAPPVATSGDEAPLAEAPLAEAPLAEPPQPAVEGSTGLELPPPPLPPPPPPPNGNGRLVGGSITIALGLAAVSAVGVESSREDGNPQFVAATFIPLGLAGLGIGTYLLIRGAKARRNYLEWKSYTQRDARASGEGMLVGGVMATVIGGITLVSAGVRAREADAFDTALVPSLFVVGGVGVLGGVGLMTAGLLSRSRYGVWRQSTFLSHVAPVLAPSRQGLSVGLVGRF